MKIISWNVNGLRAVLKSGEIQKIIKRTDWDLLCLQEIKISFDDKLKDFDFPEWQSLLEKAKVKQTWFASAEKRGYSGTMILSRLEQGERLPLIENKLIGEGDQEGRLIVFSHLN